MEEVDRCEDIIGIKYWSDNMLKRQEVSHYDEEKGWLVIKSIEGGYDYPHLNPHFLRRYLLMTNQDQGRVDISRAATEEELIRFYEEKIFYG